jgi:D-beta-D-heptose 7-phosphate kinase/D-beta-D-heptose 1-phosphate adenosyltransferase
MTKKYFESMHEKIMDSVRLQQHLKIWRLFDQKIIFTNGCFDILHQGHIALLCAAKDVNGKLVIGLNSDHSIKGLKGENRPVNDENSRAILLASLQVVDAVIIFEEETPLRLIQEITPDYLVKGGDYTIDQIIGSKEVLSHGGSVEIIPLVQGFSTTNIIKKMAS